MLRSENFNCSLIYSNLDYIRECTGAINLTNLWSFISSNLLYVNRFLTINNKIFPSKITDKYMKNLQIKKDIKERKHGNISEFLELNNREQ